MPSQSAKPGAQVPTAQPVAVHLPVPLATVHRLPHVTQFSGSAARFTSQLSSGSPLQSPLPAGQTVSPHSPLRHQGLPPAAGMHSWPHSPQFSTSRVIPFSQPSSLRPLQSVKPSSHSTLHSDASQYASPFTDGHRKSHLPQWLESVEVFTSQPFSGSPSQSA